MRRITGKFMAAVLSAVMTLSPLTGGLTVYADELEAVGLEDIAGDALVEEDDTADPAPADGDLIIEEDAEDIMSEEAAEDTVDDATAEGSDLAADGEPGLVDEGEADNDRIQTPDGDPVIPVTAGKVLRLASHGTGIQKNQHIYFGKMNQGYYTYWDLEGEQKPYWRVLDPAKDNAGGSGAILVTSETLWGNNPDDRGFCGNVVFNNDQSEGNDWQGSGAQTWCKSFLANAFSEQERAALRAISKKDAAETGTWKVCYLKGDKVFFLSVWEVENYFGTNSSEYPASYLGKPNKGWWLRTPDWGFDYCASYAGIGGCCRLNVTEPYNARPAFNINGSNILFTSAAVNGKVSGTVGAGALKAVADKGTSDWKLTIKDSTRAFHAARIGSGDVAPGSNIKVQYSGAKSGSNEFVSAVLCDNSGNVLYYGRLANNKVSGTTNVTLPLNLDAGNTYKLHVFSEQVNGNYKTDLASGLSTIDLKIPMSIKDTMLSKTELKYNGKTRIPAVTTLSGKKLTEGTDYTKTIYKDNNVVKSPKNVATYKMKITGKGNFYGSVTRTYKIVKASNPLKVKTKTSTHKFKVSKLARSAKTINPDKLYKFTDKGVGKLTYTLSYAKKGGKSYKNKFKVSSKGKLTVKKGLGKGTYTVKIKVKAKGNKNYKSKTVTLKYKIKVTK